MTPLYQQIRGAGSVTTTITVSSFAVGSGSDRTLVAIITSWWNPATGTPQVNSVVFNTSEAFTFRTKAELNFGGTRWGEVEIWTLDNPTSTTADAVATLSEAASAGSYMSIIEYTGANNGVGANFGTATGNSANPSVTFTTTTSDGLIVSGIEFNGGATNFTPDGSEVERAEGTYTDISYWSGELAATGGSQTLSLTASASGRWSMAAIELLAASGGGTTVNKDLAVQYDIGNLVNKSLAVRYDISNLVNRDLAAQFDVHNLINKDLAIQYDIGGSVGRDLAIQYDIEGGVNKDLDTQYDILGLIGKELSAQYDIRNLVNKDLAIAYDLRNLVNKDLAMLYDIAGPISKDLNMVWSIFGTAGGKHVVVKEKKRTLFV